MFKTGSVGDEIFRSMEKTLVSHQVEKTHGFDKLAKAADLLNAAAEIFDQAGMREEAAEITEVLQGLAKDLSGKTSLRSFAQYVDVNQQIDNTLQMINTMKVKSPGLAMWLDQKADALSSIKSTLKSLPSDDTGRRAAYETSVEVIKKELEQKMGQL